MSEVVVDTLRIKKDCGITGNVHESKRIQYSGPCTQAKVKGRATVGGCIFETCTRLKYLIDGQEVFTRVINAQTGSPPVTVEFEIMLKCTEIQGKTHTLYAEGCDILALWNVDAQANVVAMVETAPTPTPTPTPPGPITDPWVLAMVMAAVIMAAALVAVALIVRR
jgi:hypothetical protein